MGFITLKVAHKIVADNTLIFLSRKNEVWHFMCTKENSDKMTSLFDLWKNNKKKYFRMSSAAVVIGTLKVKIMQ